MDIATGLLMLFPAFLIGLAFGSLVIMALSGGQFAGTASAVKYCALGSLAGGVIFLLTFKWWPPVVGPFILCPASAATAGFLRRRRP